MGAGKTEARGLMNYSNRLKNVILIRQGAVCERSSNVASFMFPPICALGRTTNQDVQSITAAPLHDAAVVSSREQDWKLVTPGDANSQPPL